MPKNGAKLGARLSIWPDMLRVCVCVSRRCRGAGRAVGGGKRRWMGESMQVRCGRLSCMLDMAGRALRARPSMLSQQ